MAMRDFARLNVYIADSNVLKTEEQVDYATSQLLADIGGQLGLWVGVSVITLAEVVEFVVDLLRYLSSIHGPYSSGRQFSAERRHSETIPVSTNVSNRTTSRSGQRGCGGKGCHCSDGTDNDAAVQDCCRNGKDQGEGFRSDEGPEELGWSDVGRGYGMRSTPCVLATEVEGRANNGSSVFGLNRVRPKRKQRKKRSEHC